jgi:hypothetical protein
MFIIDIYRYSFVFSCKYKEKKIKLQIFPKENDDNIKKI